MDSADNWRASSKLPCVEICQDELYYRDALGNVISQLFEGHGEFFGVPCTADPQHFNLLSVFVKEGRNKLVYAGSLCKDGGLIVGDPTYDLLRVLLPHVHSVTKQDIDQHITGVKQPFTRKIRAFRVKNFEGRPEGKYFSWLELGSTKVVCIDESKLATKLNRLRIDPSSSAFRGRKTFFLIHKVCHSERLHYYRSAKYTSNVWLGKDKSAITSQIKEKTKVLQRLGVCSDINEARGFCLLKVNFNDEGYLELSDFNVKVIPSSEVPSEIYIKQDDFSVIIAEVIDHEYLAWLSSQLKEMRTRNIWQPAIKELYTKMNNESRKVAIKYLLETVQKFETEEEQPLQMVDLSFAISNIPSCLDEQPQILASVLRGVEIVIMQPQDSDDESPEKQIIFQPVNCQPTLKLMEQLLTVLDKGVVTSNQGEAAAPLLPTEVISLQELFYTQMACVCSPEKALNHHEEPLRSLWKKMSRTRAYLESVGLYEQSYNQQKVVMCPKTSELLNILSMFFPEVD